jgi:predicted transcriptional regulator
MKYRNRSEICAQILETANGGVMKTKIMYKAFLSYEQMKEYLVVLVENNLIMYDKETGRYKTTEKGLKFVQLYNKMGALMVLPKQQEIAELARF